MPDKGAQKSGILEDESMSHRIPLVWVWLHPIRTLHSKTFKTHQIKLHKARKYVVPESRWCDWGGIPVSVTKPRPHTGLYKAFHMAWPATQQMSQSKTFILCMVMWRTLNRTNAVVKQCTKQLAFCFKSISMWTRKEFVEGVKLGPLPNKARILSGQARPAHTTLKPFSDEKSWTLSRFQVQADGMQIVGDRDLFEKEI